MKVLEVGVGERSFFCEPFLNLQDLRKKIRRARRILNSTNPNDNRLDYLHAEYTLRHWQGFVEFWTKMIKEWEEGGYSIKNIAKKTSHLICLDYDFQIGEGQGFKNPMKVRENICRLRDMRIFSGEIDIVKADGRNLPFPSGLFDVVTLNDVLSVPAYNECKCVEGTCVMGADRKCVLAYYYDEDDENTGEASGCGCDFYSLGVSDEDKKSLVKEAIRILHPGSLLIIAGYSTTFNGKDGYDSLRDFAKNGEIELKFFDEQYHQAVFRKTNGFQTIESSSLYLLDKWSPESTTSRFNLMCC